MNKKNEDFTLFVLNNTENPEEEKIYIFENK